MGGENRGRTGMSSCYVMLCLLYCDVHLFDIILCVYLLMSSIRPSP